MTDHGQAPAPWTTQELADGLRTTKRKVLAMIHAGEIRATRLGPRTFRIPHDEALRLIRGAGAEDADDADGAEATPLAVA